jgi:hypothetical protein
MKGSEIMAELDTVSYDQYKNIPSYEDLNQKVKIIFSSECYENIMKMSIDAINKNREYGRFFVGRKISENPEVIYFDYNTSEFAPARGPMGEGKAVNPIQQNYNELNIKIEEYKSKDIIPVVLHFHSHPRDGYYESFSDQDLQVYAKMQADNSNCITLGMLGFPIDNTPSSFGMCIVQPFNARITNGIGTADFIRCEDIYYTSKNEIYSVGKFEKRYNGRLHKPNLQTGIVRQYLTLRSNSKVCAEGIDPNTKTEIKPTCVGYTDTSGNLYFSNENLSLNTSTTSKTNTTKMHK